MAVPFVVKTASEKVLDLELDAKGVIHTVKFVSDSITV